MRLWFAALALVGLVGCPAYVTRDEYLEAWDQDADGWPVGEDCNDNNAEFWPGAPDVRGDGCDSDCTVASDRDGDDWPDDADCDPDDPTVYPCAADVATDEIDSDCDGATTPRAGACPTQDPNHPDEGITYGASCACPSAAYATEAKPTCDAYTPEA